MIPSLSKFSMFIGTNKVIGSARTILKRMASRRLQGNEKAQALPTCLWLQSREVKRIRLYLGIRLEASDCQSIYALRQDIWDTIRADLRTSEANPTLGLWIIEKQPREWA